jgi:proteasome-associated ATPase
MSDTVSITTDELLEIKGQLIHLETELSRLLSQPLIHATVVKASNKFDLNVFEHGDRLLVIDKELRKQKRFFGKIVSQGVDEDGWAIIEYPQGGRDRVNIGLNNEFPQVKLIGKDDGTNVTITIDGKLFEVHGLPGVSFSVSEGVKVDMETKQIHSATGSTSAGDVAYIKSIVDKNHIEVENNGSSRVVIYGLDQPIEPSDRVMLDNSSTVVIRVLERDGKDRFNLTESSDIGWDDIAGIENAKEQLIEALETPYKHPDVYKFYNMAPPKGVLLYGPQGCGKTLAGKAAAASLARTHGKENFQSGFIYVKGPELLSKWVGQAEQEIRGLFSRGREHYEKHGYPALLFIDEADSLLPMRGTGKSSDIENTVVPQFLSEMDGLESSGVMVLLATNQPRRLDPAVVREGRIDRHVKISRPHLKNAIDYFRIHMKGLPIVDGLHVDELADIGIRGLFSANRVMYRVSHHNTTELFRLADAVTGAMIAGVVAQAKSSALKRDLNNGGKPKGVIPDDFRQSVENTYIQHADLNVTFDLEDFCDRHGFDRKTVNIEKLSVAK